MTALDYQARKADPRCAMAAQLFETSSFYGRLGNSSHARDNILYALQMSVLTPEESGYSPDRHAELLQDIVDRWIKAQYRLGWLQELQRFQRSVLAKYPDGRE